MRLRIFAVFLSAVLLLSGCGPAPVTVGGHKREKRYDRIVSLSPSTSEILGSFANPQAVKGRTAACNYPRSILPVEVVVSGTKPDYEKILSTKPDLIIYDAAIYGPADIEKIKSLKVDTLEMKVNDLKSYEDFLGQIGSKLGGETAISEYLDKVYAERDAAIGAIGTEKVPTMVLMGSPGAEYMAAGTKTFLIDCVTSAGGQAVGPDADKWVTINAEEIIKLNPSVIFMPDQGAAALEADPRFVSVKAIKNKRVYELKGDYMLRAGARVNDLIKALSSEILRAKE